MSSIVVLGACGGQDAVAPEKLPAAPLPPLAARTWYAHHAAQQPLPALIGQRTVREGVVEQSYLDSARFDVLSDGTWAQTSWLQRFEEGRWRRADSRIDRGRWSADSVAYRFVALDGSPRFSLGRVGPDTLTVPLRLDSLSAPVETVLRPQPPAPTPVGFWRADAIRDQPLATPIYVFDPEDVDGRLVSVHLIVDSAQIRLEANGRYEHSISYSEWIGPVGGGPTQRRYRLRWQDFGSWRRTGSALALESGFFQNHRMGGDYSSTGTLRIQHGLVAGDPPVAVRYGRTP